MNDEIIDDIWNWVTSYIEVNHKFYDYKFPPCPYARAARLKGLLDVRRYHSGSKKDFIRAEVDKLIVDEKINNLIMVFPCRTRWNYFLKSYIEKLNETLIQHDYYAQYGTAITTKCRYPGLFNNGPYFVVLVNKLSDVMDAHNKLLKTDYYDFWDPQHYEDVVIRRQKASDKAKNNE